MPDYKKMYFTLFRATEQAINTLIEAQRECEELYISEPETELRVNPLLDRADIEKNKLMHKGKCSLLQPMLDRLTGIDRALARSTAYRYNKDKATSRRSSLNGTAAEIGTQRSFHRTGM